MWVCKTVYSYIVINNYCIIYFCPNPPLYGLKNLVYVSCRVFLRCEFCWLYPLGALWHVSLTPNELIELGTEHQSLPTSEKKEQYTLCASTWKNTHLLLILETKRETKQILNLIRPLLSDRPSLDQSALPRHGPGRLWAGLLHRVCYRYSPLIQLPYTSFPLPSCSQQGHYHISAWYLGGAQKYRLQGKTPMAFLPFF